MSNLPITIANVQRAPEKIYGPSVQSIKGHTTQQQQAAVQVLMTVQIPSVLYEEYRFLVTIISLDFFFVRTLLVIYMQLTKR